MKLITGEREEKVISQKEVFIGEVRDIVIPADKTPFGFICSHSCHEITTDIFFSFKSIDSKKKIVIDDTVSFKLKKNEEGSKCWAIEVRKYEVRE